MDSEHSLSNSMTNTNRNRKTVFREQEQAKNREYMQRVLEIEHCLFKFGNQPY